MKNKADNKKRNFLTHSEIESLLKAANTGPHAARNYCLTLLCFIHGFRASEICRLRISDIDLKAKCIYIHRLKKGFSTTHPLLNKEVQALKNWLSIRTSYPHAESEWVFLSRKGNPLSRQQFSHYCHSDSTFLRSKFELYWKHKATYQSTHSQGYCRTEHQIF